MATALSGHAVGVSMPTPNRGYGVHFLSGDRIADVSRDYIIFENLQNFGQFYANQIAPTTHCALQLTQFTLFARMSAWRPDWADWGGCRNFRSFFAGAISPDFHTHAEGARQGFCLGWLKRVRKVRREGCAPHGDPGYEFVFAASIYLDA
ncbi:MAG TPA: hypothetical protein VGJ15_08815 [Pirellulales bacterium]|jgi:hypothetical protein